MARLFRQVLRQKPRAHLHIVVEENDHFTSGCLYALVWRAAAGPALDCANRRNE